jgi:AraC-like DNA-binding protein
MRKNLIISDYWKEICKKMQEISDLAQSKGPIQDEFLSSLETLENSISGNILLLFLEIILLFISRLITILFSIEKISESDRYHRDRMLIAEYHIQKNLSQNINEKNVANLVGMSTAYFSRVFTKIYKCNFVEYLTQHRIKFSVNLLIDTELKIIDICYRSGFSSHNQFNRAFKKEMNMTPSEYRSEFKKTQVDLLKDRSGCLKR